AAPAGVPARPPAPARYRPERSSAVSPVFSASTIDLDAVTAIDVHVHVHASVHGHAVGEDALADMSAYFRSDVTASTVRDIAAYYRERRMAAVVFGVDHVSGRETGAPRNEEIAELAAENSDVIIPFASIDPARGAS